MLNTMTLSSYVSKNKNLSESNLLKIDFLPTKFVLSKHFKNYSIC